MKQFLPLIFSKNFFTKIFAIALILLVVWVFRGFFSLFLITFIFSYLSLEVAQFLRKKILIQSAKNPHSFWKILEKYGRINNLVTILYILFVLLVIWLFASILPKIAMEIEIFVKKIPSLMGQFEKLLLNFEESTGIVLGVDNIMNEFSSSFNFQETGREVIKYIQNTGGILFQFFIGLIMSYIFVIDRQGIFSFFGRMNRGNFSFIYKEFQYINRKILDSFGKVFKAQGIIALVNSILTTIGLLIIGFFFTSGHFPFIFTLSIIVFIFGFIPVFGTFLSGIPIIIIAYGVEDGGLSMVIAIIIMISLVHAIEAYILNPKIVSSYVHFPVFVSFATLIISEHLFGMIGLLIGVPFLAMAISIFGDIDRYISQFQKNYELSKNSSIPEWES